MNGNTEEEIYLKFPTILENRLKNNEIRFPKGTEYCYNAIKAFRAVERLKDDYRKVDRNDFQSYADACIDGFVILEESKDDESGCMF